MRNARIVLFFILSGFAFSSFGQEPYLLFTKLGHRLKVKYQKGDEIEFYMNDKDRVWGKIESFEGDSVIVIRKGRFNVNEIAKIKVDNRIGSHFMFKYKFQRTFTIAALGYLGIDWINNGDLSRETLATSLILLSTGNLIGVIVGNKIKIKGRYRLRIIDSP